MLPPTGVSTDQVLVFWEQQGQPIVYVAKSNLVAPGTNVLTRTQVLALADALARLHAYFRVAYGTGVEWYALEVDWKFEGEPGEEPRLYIKQARPFQDN